MNIAFLKISELNWADLAIFTRFVRTVSTDRPRLGETYRSMIISKFSIAKNEL